MADEISYSTSFSVTKDGTTISASATKTITMSGSPKLSSTQEVGTTTEAVSIGDITAIGYIHLKNLDATNFIEIGITTPVSAANAMITLLPGESAVFPTRLETIYAKADTASCNLDVAAASL